MKKIAPILLLILTIGFAALWVKQREDYMDLKGQRTTLRKEIEDLKILRERAQKALETETDKGAQVEKQLGTARQFLDRYADQLAKERKIINGYIFRGLEPGRGKPGYWQVLQISTIPDPQKTVYKDCLVAVKLKAHPPLRWKEAVRPTEEHIITGLVWGFQDRVPGPIATLASNDLVLCETIAVEHMDENIQTLQMVDEIGSLEAPFYLAHLEPTHTEALRKQLIEPPQHVPSRAHSISNDLARINQQVAARGGWENWFEETRPYRNELADLLEAKGAPLNHENRIYMPSVKPLDLRPNRDYPDLHFRIIRTLRDQLAKQDIALIVAPVPTKEMVNASFFIEEPPADRILNPYRLQLFQKLLEADIEVIDFLEPLIDALGHHPHVFYDAQDAHPADGAIQTVAHVLSQRLARYGFTPAETHVHLMQTRYRVKARYFEPRSAVGFPYIGTRVFHENMEPLAEYAGDESPILMITDSFAGVPGHYNVWSANILAHIYKEIGVLAQKYQQNMGGPLVLQNFPNIPKTYFTNKKVCVFLFGEFYIAYPDDIRVRWIVPNE